MPIYKNREMRSVVGEQLRKAEEALAHKTVKEPLEWRPVSYQVARQKYGFRIFAKRKFLDSRYKQYLISIAVPNSILYDPVEAVPNGVAFQEAKDSEFNYVRLLKDGFTEGPILKIPKKK